MDSGNTTEAKEGPWSLGKRKVKVTGLGGEGRGRSKVQACSWEGEPTGCSILKSQGSIPIECPSAFLASLSGPWSPLIGWYQGRGSLVNVAGPDVGHGVSCVVLLPFRAWSRNATEAWMYLMQVRTSLSWRLNA